MKEEIWRPIKGYETYYEVSNFGNVRSLDRIVVYSDGVKHLWKGRILKPAKNKDGYLVLNLCKNSKCKSFKVHRLVAEAFLPNPDNIPEVNHKDENKTNNHVYNLEWCSHLYNIRFGTRLKKLSKSVLQIDKNTNEVIEEYSSTMEAERQLNIFHNNISACCKGKCKTAGGFKWRHKKE